MPVDIVQIVPKITSDTSLTRNIYINVCRPQCSRGLKRGSAAARLLGLRVRIPLGHGCVFLVTAVRCQVEVAAMRRLLVQRSPTECGVSERDRKTLIIIKNWPIRGW